MDVGALGDGSEESAGFSGCLIDVEAYGLAVTVKITDELLLDIDGGIVVTDRSGYILDVLHQSHILILHIVTVVHIISESKEVSKAGDLPRVTLCAFSGKWLKSITDSSEIIVGIDCQFLVGNRGFTLTGVVKVKCNGGHSETCRVSSRNDGGIESVTIVSIDSDSDI